MAPTSKYLTFSPSTSTTRSILEEPPERIQESSERILEPSEWIQEPSERSQAPLAQSQKPQERNLGQENSKWSEGTIELIVKLKTMNTPWRTIGEAVGLPQNTCYQIWDDYSRQQAKAKAVPKPEPSRQKKSWSKSEDEILVRLRKADCEWDEIAAQLEGRNGNASRLRFNRLCEEAQKAPMGQTKDGD